MKRNNYVNDHYEFGYKLFGPFLYAFVCWLKLELEKKGYDRAFFFSRDGYMMKKAFDIINDGSIKSEYVYVSRKSLSQPLLWRCKSFESSLRFLNKERYISVGRLLEYYGFNEKERQSIAQKNGYDLELDIPYDRLKSSDIAKDIYINNVDIIKDKSKQQDKLLERYLIQVGMSGKCAIVDIGWHGSMQYYLSLYSRLKKLVLSVEGYYVGVDSKFYGKLNSRGFIYNHRADGNRKKLLCFFGVYEKLFQSLEGSTDGYVIDNGIEPVLMPYEYDINADSGIIFSIKQCQAGAIDYVMKKKKSEIKDGSSVDLDEHTIQKYTNPLIRFGMKPRLADTSLFSGFYNTDGTKIYYTAQKKLLKYGVHELIHALGKSPWKTGFMKSVFKIPFPYFLIYRLLRR